MEQRRSEWKGQFLFLAMFTRPNNQYKQGPLKANICKVKVNLTKQERGLQHIDSEVIKLKEDIIPNIKTEL